MVLLAQGGVFLLQDAEGTTDPNHVLKVVFKFGIGGLFGMTNLEREWRVGRQLALLTEPGAALPGFMGTGAGVITMSGHFTGIAEKSYGNAAAPLAFVTAHCSTMLSMSVPIFLPCTETHFVTLNALS